MSERFLVLEGDSQEVVAYALLRGIAASEGKTISNGTVVADKRWLLKTYGECLSAVRSGFYEP